MIETLEIEQLCSNCKVPVRLHGTCCGWNSANMITFPGEETINATPSAEEMELRWLISKSPNANNLIKAVSFVSPHSYFIK